ncbi:unnamed protein product [Urochloa decumbens]|uniref:Flavin-containing monooxygenase n=1 Tax=Urochloa decumbens TaxID=240449 RepID=A0ABC9FP76_9POAL
MASDRSPEHKKVCVVGAGMSGLAAARELRREGHTVTVMEQRGDVGGQWLYDPRTDADDPLGAAAPVKVHSSVYASARLMSPRECMGFSDFQFVPRPGAGRDARRYPGRREVYCYLKDFFAAFGLGDAVRLNTRVLRVAMAPPPPRDDASCGGAGDVKWLVRSVRVEPDGGEPAAVEEVFDAVVVASGNYSQPRLPSIEGMATWPRRQLHSHSYRTPEPFRGEVVVVVGCGESGLDIATELCGVAKEVQLVAKSTEDAAAPPPALSKMLAKHDGIRLRPPVDKLTEDGTVAFVDGSGVAADTVIYCTGYRYSFPFLDTAGAVALDAGGGRARWVALVLSGKAALPPEAEMMRAVEEDYRTRELAGVPSHLAHAIPAVDRMEVFEFVYRHTDLPRMEGWKLELFVAGITNSMDDRDTFRDIDDDSESVRGGLQMWRRIAGAQYEAALAAAVSSSSGDHVHVHAVADADAAEMLEPPSCQVSTLN